ARTPARNCKRAATLCRVRALCDCGALPGRARGDPARRGSAYPFAGGGDPDHFAAYLAMTVPLFISRAWGALAADDGGERDETTPILCSAALVVVVCAIMLSQSRAIWAGTLLSCVLF